jgi:protein O-GlcNAc transferase
MSGRRVRHLSSSRGTPPRLAAASPHVIHTLEKRFHEGKQFELAQDFKRAEAVYRELVAGFDRKKLNAATPCAALGYALLNQRKFDEAETVLKRAVRLNPSVVEGPANLAAVYRLTERWLKCIAMGKRALEINPKHVPTLLNLGEAQKETRQYALSVQNFLLVLALDNENVDARKGLASNYVWLGDPSVAIPLYRKVLAMDSAVWHVQSHMLFAMQYEPTLSNEEVLAEHVAYGEKVREEVGPPRTSFSRDLNPNRRIRIGYISSDFKYHVVMRFAENIIASHNRDRFEVVLIHTSAKKDKDTERIKQHADQWVEIGEMHDGEAAEKIWDCELDILVDLAGHSGVNKLALLGRRLAPVQVLWLGYSGTSGIDTMDYVIVDNVIAPPRERHFFTEQPLRLSTAYLAFTEHTNKDPGELPFYRNGYITFGSMNNPSKVNKYVAGWWAQILCAVPNSKMVMRYALFADPLVRERIARVFREAGIDSARVDMAVGANDFTDIYRDIDIALDTFHYNGTTTTCEALWMGVPVIGLRGDRFVSRVGASLLTHAGLANFVTETPEQYIAKAVELAGKPDELARLRTRLRPHLRTTPVYDGDRFTAGLEECYGEIFRNWCATQAHRSR